MLSLRGSPRGGASHPGAPFGAQVLTLFWPDGQVQQGHWRLTSSNTPALFTWAGRLSGLSLSLPIWVMGMKVSFFVMVLCGFFFGRFLSLHTIGLSFGTAHGGFRFLELLPAPCRCPVGKPPGHLVQSRPQHPLPRLLDFLRCLSTLHGCQMGAPWQLSALSGGFLACLTQVTFLKLLK